MSGNEIHVSESETGARRHSATQTSVEEERESARSNSPCQGAPESVRITPQMLTMIDLDQQQIDVIVQTAPGGAGNVQDIYPLSPLQEAMLFQHVLDENRDTNVLSALLELQSQRDANGLINALQRVIARHDALRTAIVLENLPRPVQVVYRSAPLSVEHLSLDPSRDTIKQLKERMSAERRRLDLRRAPLLQVRVAKDPCKDRWYVLLQRHHIVFDHQSWSLFYAEVLACMHGHEEALPHPQQYRDYVAWSLANARAEQAEAFFRARLATVDEPTAAFAITDRPVTAEISEARQILEPELARALRTQARLRGVSAARLWHAAWALVVAHTSGRDDIVFGTVLAGSKRMSGRARCMLGLFVNTLPLRLQLEGRSVARLLEQTDRELSELLHHQHVPLSLAQRCSGLDGATPLVTAVLNYRHSAGHSVLDGNVQTPGIRVLAQQYGTAFPIMLVVDDLGDGFTLTAQTTARADPNRLIGYAITAMQSLLRALDQDPEQLALTLTIMPKIERDLLLEHFNATRAPYPQEKLVHELFEQQVERTPGAIALTYKDVSLTYAELDRKAHRLAQHLNRQGVGPQQLVAIYLERSVELVISVLGVLKAGAAYLPLDPTYPAERLAYMLSDASPRVVLTHENLRPTLPQTQAEVIALDTLLSGITPHADQDLTAASGSASLGDLVYVIYTSGTTGRPKGTAMTHRSMVNLIEWHRETLSAHGGQRVLQFAALSFDVAFQEIFSTLCTGGSLALLDERIRRDAQALMQFLSERAIQRIFVPPLMLQSLAEYCRSAQVVPPTSLRDVVTAGEQLRVSREIRDFFGHLEGCRLHNHYGPTETHVVTALTLTGDSERWPALPSIGRPIANVQIHVLDARRRPTPLGVVGEIYIGGANVARGYLNRPELTVQRFVEDPFCADPQGRLYKTGDLGRWQADGELEYLGRNDEQVKIRGYRIEPSEVEAQLARLDRVRESVVVVREDGAGEKRLVAYVVAREPADPPRVEEVRTSLAAVLPQYMVPSGIVLLDRLPLTPSGKLNRHALPEPQAGAYVCGQYEAPQGNTEIILAEIWRELLRVERVGRQDNFFSLGGHSLLLLRLAVRIADRLDVRIPIHSILRYPQLQQVASVVDNVLLEPANPAGALTWTESEEFVI
jgi:amino acid adenylation domain-containing protein